MSQNILINLIPGVLDKFKLTVKCSIDETSDKFKLALICGFYETSDKFKTYRDMWF
jgi:predicted oxidoreductase